LIALVWLAAGPAFGQTGGERVPLILSRLPAQGTTAYESLRRQAGNDVSVESLSLTKSEVWTVAGNRVGGLRAAAARIGVGVTGLAADWNHLFRPMSARPGGKGPAAHEGIGSSPATVGIGMALPPRAAMVEYALTRGMNAGAGSAPARVILRLNGATELSAIRTSVIIEPHMCVWHGTVEGTGAPVTLMWWPGVTMAGTVRHEGRIFSIRRARGGVHTIAIVEMSEAQMPPEHAPMPPRLRNDPGVRDDPLVRSGDASTLKRLRLPVLPRPARPQGGAGNDRSSELPAIPPGGSAEQSTGSDAPVVIRAMVAYTGKAARRYADIGRELVELAVEETNQSFRNSGLARIRLELVHTYQTDYVEDGEHFDHLWRFADRGDGHMEEVHALREKHDADVAILIVDDPKGCGLATRVFADPEDAFAVVHHECAAATFSVAHEIGHLIGARHELEVDRSMTPFPYGHGYVNGTKWRDIMSHKESCGGCPRLPVWSNPRRMIGGESAGALNADNARVIDEQAARVARFRPSLAGRVFTSGPPPGATGSRSGDAPR
jgi:hypothetical protein